MDGTAYVEWWRVKREGEGMGEKESKREKRKINKIRRQKERGCKRKKMRDERIRESERDNNKQQRQLDTNRKRKKRLKEDSSEYTIVAPWLKRLKPIDGGGGLVDRQLVVRGEGRGVGTLGITRGERNENARRFFPVVA